MKALPTTKSFVQAMYLLTNALGYAFGEAFTPLVGDPGIMWLCVGLCTGALVLVPSGHDEKSISEVRARSRI
jgi:proton-dependent oligopeptide transporter, POT family